MVQKAARWCSSARFSLFCKALVFFCKIERSVPKRKGGHTSEEHHYCFQCLCSCSVRVLSLCILQEARGHLPLPAASGKKRVSDLRSFAR
jgi:hypothetical protein